jgi:hypothetical protein
MLEFFQRQLPPIHSHNQEKESDGDLREGILWMLILWAALGGIGWAVVSLSS